MQRNRTSSISFRAPESPPSLHDAAAGRLLLGGSRLPSRSCEAAPGCDGGCEWSWLWLIWLAELTYLPY